MLPRIQNSCALSPIFVLCDNRRLDHIVQMQLDEHATRIKKLEAAVFSK
jgi:hypothetical protein